MGPRDVKSQTIMVRRLMWFWMLLLNRLPSEIRDIAQLLDVDEQILLNCLTKSGSSWLQIENGSELDAINANLINKALCRTLYGRLFTFVVNRINDSLKVRLEAIKLGNRH